MKKVTAKFKKELADILYDKMFIGNCCLSYRHDYGLLSKKEQDLLIFEFFEWSRAILNNLAEAEQGK